MSFDLVIAGVGGQPIDRMVEILAAVCEEAGQAFASTAPRGVTVLGGSRLAQVSVGECWSPVVTEDTGGLMLALEIGEALRYAKYCEREAVLFADSLRLPPAAPRDERPYPGAPEVEPALREVIRAVFVADFRALAGEGGPEHAYAALLGAASQVKGLDPIKDAWKAGLKAARATAEELAAFNAGADWAGAQNL